jgi:hypothetical protein
MLRAIVGGIIGYLVMALAVFVGFSAAYLALGADWAFQPGSYDASGQWIILSLALGLVAAIVGGWICTAITDRPRPARVLAGIVLVLGLFMAVPTFMPAQSPGPRTGDVPMMDAMQRARTPAWLAVINPFIGAAGILIGGRKRGATSPPPASGSAAPPNPSSE